MRLRRFTRSKIILTYNFSRANLEIGRDQIGPSASFKQVVVVKQLPKTKSGKILRGTMRRIVDGKKYAIPSTIDDPTILKEIEKVVQMAQQDKNK